MQISSETREKLNRARVLITFDTRATLSMCDLLDGSLRLIGLGDLLVDVFNYLDDSDADEKIY